MKRKVALSLDQLYRPQPGGIGTYIRGLVSGLQALSVPDLALVGMGPRGASEEVERDLHLPVDAAPVPLALLSRLWSRWPLGVPSDAQVVHATSMAGPFAGGAKGAMHSAMIHDVLWREVGDLTTKAGAAFHEARLQLLRERDDIRIFVTSTSLKQKLTSDGFSPERVWVAPLGVDDDQVVPASSTDVAALLGAHGVTGPYTLHVGTREPRKNIARLVEAHQEALRQAPELGPLVLIGPEGWGSVATGDAVVLGAVARPLLQALYRDASVVAFVPLAEGWGLPAVEALHVGTRVVASTTTPSVEENETVVRVNPLDVASIAEGLVRAVQESDDAAERQRRQDSVRSLTWRACAEAHLEGWQ